MDTKEDGTITIKSFIKCLKDYRIEITEQDIYLIMSFYSNKEKNGMNYESFMKQLIKPMNDFRRKLTDKLFSKLDKDKSAKILIEELKERFDPIGHPEVLNNKKTKSQIYSEFAETLAYYNNIDTQGNNVFTYE